MKLNKAWVIWEGKEDYVYLSYSLRDFWVGISFFFSPFENRLLGWVFLFFPCIGIGRIKKAIPSDANSSHGFKVLGVEWKRVSIQYCIMPTDWWVGWRIHHTPHETRILFMIFPMMGFVITIRWPDTPVWNTQLASQETL